MTTAIAGYDRIAVFVGLDVGKSEHHAVALDRSGKRLLDRALPQDEARLRHIIADLAEHGPVLLVVDQPATVGALPVAVARAAGASVGYLPGLVMRRIADLHPGEAKTDARDAAIIADTARTMPHTLRSIAVADEQVAELTMLCGFDDDLAGQITQVSNRIRGLLTQIHPALERVIGPRLDHPAILALLRKHPSPDALRTAGVKRLGNLLLKHAPRKGRVWAVEGWVRVVVDAGGDEFAGCAANVDGDACFGRHRGASPLGDVVFQCAGAAVIGDGAVLERDAAAVGEEQGVELGEFCRAGVRVLASGGFADGCLGFECGEGRGEVSCGEGSLVVADCALLVDVRVVLE